MSKEVKRVVCAIVENVRVTFYHDDGSEPTILLQGDKRLRPILEKHLVNLEKGIPQDIDFTSENSYREFEQKSGGVVRLFKIAKAKLAEIFAKRDESALPIGKYGKTVTDEKRQKAIEEIVQNATSVSETSNFKNVAEQRPVAVDGVATSDRANNGQEAYHAEKSETVVAVTKDGHVLPGVEKIKSQLKGAAESGNIAGMNIAIERMAKISTKRGHTMEDLLRFQERGDLPFDAFGNIVAYKKLSRRDGHFVDVHSGKVVQRVGSLVYMDEKLVDPSRRNECSNGLHVARRQYVGQFGGNAIVIIKIRPEDVIAVPDYDANKMRVCAYQIVEELTQPQFHAINGNRPISDAEGGLDLLNKVLSTDYKPNQKVKITQQQGGGLQVTDLDTPAEKGQPMIQVETKVKEITPAKEKPAINAKPLEAEQVHSDTPIAPQAALAVAKGTSDDLAAPVKPLITQATLANDLYQRVVAKDKAAAVELLAFKKKAKKGWVALGLPANTAETCQDLIKA